LATPAGTGGSVVVVVVAAVVGAPVVGATVDGVAAG
jgi:hypothetical protein